MSTNNIHFSSLSKTKAFRLAFVVLSHRGTIPLYPNGCGIYFFNLQPTWDTVLLLASGHLSRAFCISWLCFLAGWAENWANLYKQLPISAK